MTLAFQPGQPVPHRADWRFAERLGAGAFGEVWRVRQPDLDREEAIKFAASADAADLLRREAAAMRALARHAPGHPNIIRICGHNLDSDPAWIAMEHAAGGSLAERIESGPMGADEARRVLSGVCAALDVAHHAGVVHGDVKPANILFLADGTPLLADFGLGTIPDSVDQAASAVIHSALQSKLAGPGGTPLFLSPERLAGNEPTPADDVFAVGVSMLQALCGDPLAHPQYAPVLLKAIDDEPLRDFVLACLGPARLRPNGARDDEDYWRTMPSDDDWWPSRGLAAADAPDLDDEAGKRSEWESALAELADAHDAHEERADSGSIENRTLTGSTSFAAWFHERDDERTTGPPGVGLRTDHVDETLRQVEQAKRLVVAYRAVAKSTIFRARAEQLWGRLHDLGIVLPREGCKPVATPEWLLWLTAALALAAIVATILLIKVMTLPPGRDLSGAMARPGLKVQMVAGALTFLLVSWIGLGLVIASLVVRRSTKKAVPKHVHLPTWLDEFLWAQRAKGSRDEVLDELLE